MTKYETRPIIVAINSKDRNVNVFPDPNYYQVTFPEVRNVVAIELIAGVIPDVNSVSEEPYLVMQVDEFRHRSLIATDTTIENAFAVLQLTPPVVTGKFINIDMAISQHLVHQVVAPIPALSKMTVRLFKQDGQLMDFDAANHMFVFRLTIATPPQLPGQVHF